MVSARNTIRKALADTLDGTAGFRAAAYTPRQLNPPQMVVTQLDQQPTAFGTPNDSHDYTAVVRMLMAGDIESAQEKLDEAADAVEQALFDDQTLGGKVDFAVWQRTRGDSEGLIEMGGTSGFATYAVLDFEVQISG